jgi:hypothetical protein
MPRAQAGRSGIMSSRRVDPRTAPALGAFSCYPRPAARPAEVLALEQAVRPRRLWRLAPPAGQHSEPSSLPFTQWAPALWSAAMFRFGRSARLYPAHAARAPRPGWDELSCQASLFTYGIRGGRRRRLPPLILSCTAHQPSNLTYSQDWSQLGLKALF